MKQKLYTALQLLSCSFMGFSQTMEVSGTVKDDEGQMLPGVSIRVKGTDKGAISSYDGGYVISANKGDTLVFSYIGFTTQEVVVDGNTLNISLESGVLLEGVVVVGSRNVNRTAVDTPVPVDVLDVQTLTQVAPQITVNEILNYAAPSFSSNPQTISDGTDHIAPASLRGLGPDQVLILINGKRRHKTALLNVNGTFGRGSVGSDLSTIPSNAIERIEILRDGAAAQYGSDAIAGVINIVLRKTTKQLQVNATTGANFTSESGPSKNVDGEKVNLGLNYGLPLGENGGYINFTGTFNFRGWTNRMQQFEGKIFNAYNSIERVASNAGYNIANLLDDDIADVKQYATQVTHFSSDIQARIASAADKATLRKILNADDVTDAELLAREQSRSDYNMRVGQSELLGGQFFVNMAFPLGENFELYSFGGISYKNGNAAGFYRLPYQSRTYTPVYLNGFLPEINSDITDNAIVIGIRGKFGAWSVDFSNSFGKNGFLYRVSNSLNASLGNSTPLEANSGGFSYSENTTNFDVNRFYDDIFAGFNIAFGAEYRLENYAIIAGEEASYTQYDTLGNTYDSTDPESHIPVDFFGGEIGKRPGGIQVFPGFRPSSKVDAYRNSIAAYADLEADITKSFLLSGAIRFENFSDFGSTLNFKLASRIKASENINVRAGLQTGFRAPSLHQIHYSSTSTLFENGVPNEIGVFPNTSEVARILGIDPLKKETSVGFMAGFTAIIPNANVKLTVDGYLININDRVVLTGNFDDNNDAQLANLFAKAGATKAAFLANAVNTKTKGIDLVVDHQVKPSNSMTLINTLSFTFSGTSAPLEEVYIPSAILKAGLSEKYFGGSERNYLESGVPTVKGNLSHSLKWKEKWSLFLRNSYFGSVEEVKIDSKTREVTETYVYNGKVVTDLSIGYGFSDSVRFTIGANNLLDIYPDKRTPDFNSSGRFVYPRRAVQFGTGGRHLYAKLNLSL